MSRKVASATYRLLLRALPHRQAQALDSTMSSLLATLKDRHLGFYRHQSPEEPGRVPCSLLHPKDPAEYQYWIENAIGPAALKTEAGTYTLAAVVQRRGLPPADVTIVPVNPLTSARFLKSGWRIVPRKVDCIRDLDIPIDTWLVEHGSRGLKGHIKSVTKLGYSTRPLTLDSFDEFYHRMLVPTISIRHQDKGHVSSMEKTRGIAAKGTLLGLFRGSEWVGGAIMEDKPGSNGAKGTRNALLGWRDGSPELLKERVTTALYLGMIRWAESAGYQELNFGACNPFASDGVLLFKLRWGARIESAQAGDIAVHVDTTSAGGRDFLARSPLLEKRGDRFEVVTWQTPVSPYFEPEISRGNVAWTDLGPPPTAPQPLPAT